MANITQHEKDFLKKWATEDTDDMPENVVELLMDDHFYVVDAQDLQGYFVPENNSMWSDEDEHIAQSLNLRQE